jgi:hypothetical protein
MMRMREGENMDTNANTNDYPQSAAEVWALIREVAQLQKETDRELKELSRRREADTRRREEDTRRMKEDTRQMKEDTRKLKKQMEENARRREEDDRKLKERREEDDRKLKKQMDATDKQLGKLGNRFGDMVEHLVAPGLPKKFEALGYNFDEIAPRSQIKDGATGRLIAEIDLRLTDGEHVMAVEVKAHPNVTDVDEHVERLERIRAHYDGKGDKRKILGAVAGAVFPENVRSYARKNGFYTIVQSGDTVSIDVPKGFQPREW